MTPKTTEGNHFLDRPDVGSLDRSDMLRHVCTLPAQLESALDFHPRPIPDLKARISNVLICGLGGSAIGGGIASRLVRDQLAVPLQLNRGLSIPAYVGQGTLAFVISYSGNTRETLLTFEQLLSSGAQLIVLTSGGDLGELAQQLGVPLLCLPRGIPPRTGVAYTTVPIVKQLAAFGLCRDPQQQVREAAANLASLVGELSLNSPYLKNRAKRIAAELSGRVVSVYGSQGNLDTVARRWAGQLAENGKQIAFWNALPEALHNEIVGWNHPRAFLEMRTCVLLRDPSDPRWIRLLFDDLEERLLSGQASLSIETVGKTRWEKIFGLVLLGDLVSVYVALLNGEDPTPIAAIEAHKQRLSARRLSPELDDPSHE